MLYQIENATSGNVFGVYAGEAPADAWAALCAEAGAYEQPGDDIRFTPVSEVGQQIDVKV